MSKEEDFFSEDDFDNELFLDNEKENINPKRRTDLFANRNKAVRGISETISVNDNTDNLINEDRMLTGKKLQEAVTKVKKENQANFIVELYKKGLPISKQHLEIAKELKLFTEEQLSEIEDNSNSVYLKLSEKDSVPFDKDALLNLSSMLKTKRIGNGKYQHSGEEIKTESWKPKSVISHSKEFVEFIDSMNEKGFQNKTSYLPLELYIQQAHNWLSEKDYIDNYHTHEERWEYFEREFERCRDNTLYFLEKYLMLKEADMTDSNGMKYYAKPVHEVIAFLCDSGYSLIIGKPRQIAATTTFLGYALKKLTFNKNFFVKFVTMDVDTAEEIMEDKLKFPVSSMPDYLRPTVQGDSLEGLYFGRRIPGKKGVRGGANSKFTIVAPSVSAINAGAPPLVMVDEAGYIKVLGKMLREARPTMFRQDPVTGELKMIRQVLIWSTGGVEEGKNKVKTKSFEEEVNHARDKWKEGSYDYGIVPVFFDWTTRPGITREFYEREKRNYSSGDESEREQRMNQFRLTYPSCWEDMFLNEMKLLLPISFIQENETRIIQSPVQFKPTPGYFEPILDITQKNGGYSEQGLPGRIVGARFVPTEYDDTKAAAWMFMPPDKGWRNRYYKGTDPIMTDTGTSNMASAIFDKYLGTISCIIDYRNENHSVTFLQTLLMGVYYNTEATMEEIPELVESNIGTAYIDFVDNMGFYRTLVHQTELPEAFQGGGQTIGIDNKGMRTEFIISRMREFFSLYSDKLFYLKIFQQLKTFHCTITSTGKPVWGVIDRKRYKDDVLFACVFAYICSFCYNKEPVKLGGEREKYVTVYELTRDANGNLTRVAKRKKVY